MVQQTWGASSDGDFATFAVVVDGVVVNGVMVRSSVLARFKHDFNG
jgi:hypothetical protein